MTSPARAAREAKREIARLARPAGAFDASRYFRGSSDLRFVALIPSVRRGAQLDCAYAVAARLHPDGEDLIQKAVGWMLREAGKADPGRLERYLHARGPRIPRTTVRYAIERFDERLRQDLLRATKNVDGR